MSLEDLRKELHSPPAGRYFRDLFFYRGVRDHYAEPPILAKAHGTAGFFRLVPAHIYENDRIAGSIRGAFCAPDPPEAKKAERMRRSYGTLGFLHNTDHYAPDYETFLNEGIPGRLAAIEKSRADHPEEKPLRFLKAAEITLLGFREMLHNYEVAARAAGKPEMADDLAHLQAHPPATFRQALQLTWLCYIAFVLTGRFAMAFGRMDQYLYPYFKADLEAGALTEEEATDLLACTFLKIRERLYYVDGSEVANICIGGITPAGEDAVNPLSYCILEAVRRANIPGPNLSARIHPGTPDRFLDECLKVIATGLGYPALMNDTVNIPALHRHGYSLEDARNHCFVGCIENFIPGKQPPWSDGRFNVPVFLTDVLYGDLSPIRSMEDLLAAFRSRLEYGMTEYYAKFYNENTRYTGELYAQPFLSLFCRDCIGRAKDIREGGALYPSVHGIGCMGIATIADCLAAIDHWVYTEKKYTLPQIAAALKANFEGYEPLRADLLAAPKYGNDEDFVDRYAVWYVEEMERLARPYRTYDGGALYTAIASNISNIPAGKEVPATPDGRKAYEPMSDAASPMHGMDHEGMTAVVNSISKPDYTLVSCGTVLNQKLSPRMLAEPENRAKIAALIRVYFKRGGQEIQINSVSRAILKDAMEHPENYRNLVVRVSGFSAYYTTLDRAVQEDILKRTEHNGT